MLPLGMAMGLAALSFAAPTPTAPTLVDLNRYPPQPQETICGVIVNANLYSGDIVFAATDVVQCLTSVPFNPTVALRFLGYLNQTFQFHSNTAYLRNPPSDYQQPPTDLFGQLQDVVDNVNAGRYHNQYAFEWDAQRVLQNTHDRHVAVYGGISSQMTFLNALDLVSVSVDGKQLPEVYVYEDLRQQTVGSGHSASPIVEIHGMSPVDYLKTFAANQSFGLVEPHADWNNMMRSPAQFVFGVSAFSDAAPFYPGETLEIRFKNDTVTSSPWAAIFSSPGYTGPLTTGGDFYNYFVLGLVPANFASEADAYYANQTLYNSGGEDAGGSRGTCGRAHSISSWHCVDPAYPPDTISHQQGMRPCS